MLPVAYSDLRPQFLGPANLGVGMRSMQERVQQLGGHLTLDIGKNRALLQASFPVAQAQAASA